MKQLGIIALVCATASTVQAEDIANAFKPKEFSSWAVYSAAKVCLTEMKEHIAPEHLVSFCSCMADAVSFSHVEIQDMKGAAVVCQRFAETMPNLISEPVTFYTAHSFLSSVQVVGAISICNTGLGNKEDWLFRELYCSCTVDAMRVLRTPTLTKEVQGMCDVIARTGSTLQICEYQKGEVSCHPKE